MLGIGILTLWYEFCGSGLLLQIFSLLHCKFEVQLSSKDTLHLAFPDVFSLGQPASQFGTRSKLFIGGNVTLPPRISLFAFAGGPKMA